MNHYITGHNLLQPSAPDAPLEFTKDAALIQRIHDALEDRKRTHLAGEVADALEGFHFIGEKA